MFTHAEVWRGIDRLAKQHGLTASGLARRAGLDPTTFNPSKRITKQDKPRWPSTESLAKILNATATPFDSFVALMPDRPGEAAADRRRSACATWRWTRPNASGMFDSSGFPIGDEWDEIDFPEPRGQPRLCARGPRRRHAAELSRRRSPGAVAGRQHPAPRPRPAQGDGAADCWPACWCAGRRRRSSWRRSPRAPASRPFRSGRWPGSRASCGPASRAALRRPPQAPRTACVAHAKKMAAGEPAAKATGRHHNVREDIGWSLTGGAAERDPDIKPSRSAVVPRQCLRIS